VHVSAAYDYLGRRVARTVYGSPNVVTKYAYDGDRIIAEYDGSGTLLRKFIYGPGIDEPICLIEVADNNAVYYYHLDGLGSVVALSHVNRVLVERYTYDIFGRPTIRDANGTEIEDSAFGNPYRFTGRAYDAETALYYYRARYYDYATARFLQPDPTGYTDGLSLYSYCGNNPTTFTDPLGLLGLPKEPFSAYYEDWRSRHYNRNQRNQEVTLEEVRDQGWTLMNNEESIYHRIGSGNEYNLKYVSPDGHYEAVFHLDGTLVTDPANMPTYNFSSPYEYGGAGHFFLDVVPYLLWGNSPDDPTTRFERAALWPLYRLETPPGFEKRYYSTGEFAENERRWKESFGKLMDWIRQQKSKGANM
jgi:RHS repeat-associated protein